MTTAAQAPVRSSRTSRSYWRKGVTTVSRRATNTLPSAL